MINPQALTVEGHELRGVLGMLPRATGNWMEVKWVVLL